MSDKLIEFKWTAMKAGVKEEGEQESLNQDIIMVNLVNKGYTDIKVKKKPKEFSIGAPKIEDQEINILFRQLSTMIDAGVPIDRCFKLVEEGTENKTFGKLLKEVRIDLENGLNISAALKKHPDHFDKLTCSLVQAGEEGGILDTILARVCVYKEKAAALKGKIKSAMIYPISIIAIAFIVTSVLMIFVVPVFAEMFEGLGGTLPLPTAICMTISSYFVNYWYVVVFAPVVLISVIKRLYKTESGRYKLDALVLKIPVMGDVIKKASIAKFSRTFSTLIAAGMPIIDVIMIVSDTAGNAVYEKSLADSKESINNGVPLSKPLSENKDLYPNMVIQMIAIGEESGNIETMLNKVADFYEEEVDRAVSNMTALMEPFIMAFLGVVIGGLVISMYLPIFNIASLV